MPPHTPEMAVAAVVLSSDIAVTVPGISGLKAAEVDRKTQKDVVLVAETVRELVAEAQAGKGNARDISMELASGPRVRVFPAQGAVRLIQVSEGTQLPSNGAVIHRESGQWCFSLTNDGGRVKDFHHDSEGGPGPGTCPLGQ